MISVIVMSGCLAVAMDIDDEDGDDGIMAVDDIEWDIDCVTGGEHCLIC